MGPPPSSDEPNSSTGWSRTLRTAQQGTPTTTLVGGDAGIGKTRLITESATGARERGALVLQGGCLELGDQGLPCAAVSEALRGLDAALPDPELRRLAGEDLPELARVVPGSRSEQPEVPSGAEGRSAASSQLRPFEAVLRFVGRRADGAPVVLVLEDAHRADASTRDLLVFLAHNLPQVKVVLIISFRTDELHRTHPLRGVLAQPTRQEDVDRLDLAPLGREEMSEPLEDLLAEPPSTTRLEAMFERCEGNPLLR